MTIGTNTLAMTMNNKNDLQNNFEFRILFSLKKRKKSKKNQYHLLTININTLAMTMNNKNDLQNGFKFRILFSVSTTCLRFMILLLLLLH